MHEVKSIFGKAVELRSNKERADFLDEACGTDAALRAEVEGLLAALEKAGPFMDQPAASATKSYEQASEVAGEQVGPYKLLQKLGEGGMGSVWVADQEKPVKRRVAIKVIKPGMDSRSIIARFEAERQALALMDHPNIAKVFDAGTTGDHRPYFVMELVKGVPITKFCDHEHLSPGERLELFIPVCQAVQHAHQKGIIHRDLKPTNIIIAIYDGKPVPKVIDFGVAKALHQKLSDQSIFTEVGSIIGTLEYMAPEQAELNNLDIDTRADIYSLGVILYELLTGSPPFTSKQLRGAAFTEMLRIIREVEPSKPSTKLSASEDLPSIAANRKLEPASLAKQVHGELDWIVMKCLEKDRARRYETANSLALDVQHYLEDEPVLAGPPSASYRLRKFIARNRGKVVAASLVLLSLVLGVIGTTVGLIWAERARQTALTRSKQLEKGNEILGSIFKDMNPNQEEKEGRALRAILGERLDDAAKQLECDALGDPVTVAKMQLTLGDSLVSLGHSQKALGLFLKARATFTEHLNADHTDTLQSIDKIARCYESDGKYAQAIPLLEENLENRKRVLGVDHVDTLEALNNLGVAYLHAGQLKQAIPLLEDALRLKREKWGDKHEKTLIAMNNLGDAYTSVGQFELAVPLLNQTWQLRKELSGPRHTYTIMAMCNLATAYLKQGKYELAQPLLTETLKVRREDLGAEHPLTLTSMNNLATCYLQMEKPDLAVPLLEEVLRLRKFKPGLKHPDTVGTMGNLASAYWLLRRYDLAIPLDEEALKLEREILPHGHPRTLNTMGNLAVIYENVGKVEMAVKLHEEEMQLEKETLPADHPNILTTMNNLGTCYGKLGKREKAISLLSEAVRLRAKKLGADNPDTLLSMCNLGSAYTDDHQYDQAIRTLKEALERLETKLGPDHRLTVVCQNDLGYAYRESGKLDLAIALYQRAMAAIERTGYPPNIDVGLIVNNYISCYERLRQLDRAEAVLRKWLAVVKGRTGNDSPATAGQLASLGVNLLKQKKYTEAEAVLRRCLAIREQKSPDEWNTFNTKSSLGAALLGQQKYAEAEPLLLTGYEGLKQREAKIIPEYRTIRLSEALDRLIQFYTETNKPEEVKKWQAEKAALEAKKVEQSKPLEPAKK